MTIGVVSPHTLIRKALCSLLTFTKGFQVVLDVDSAIDKYELVRKLQPETLLIDLESRLGDLELISRVRKFFPSIKIVILSDDPDETFQVRAFRAGAQGCVSKKSEPQVLENALKVVGEGEIWVTHHMATHIVGQLMRWQTSQEQSPSELTEREQQILALVANGERNKKIASRLFISENTIKTHLHAIYKKLQVSSRLGAALYYYEYVRRKSDRGGAMTVSAGEGFPDSGNARVKSSARRKGEGGRIKA